MTQGFRATRWMAKQAWETSPTHLKGSNFCGKYTLWQIRQANLSLRRLWCYLELCWICLNWWKRSGLAYLMTTELVLAPCPPQQHLKLQVVELASQNPPKGTNQNQNNKTKAQNKQTKKVSLNRIHSPIGLTKPAQMLLSLQGKGQQRAVLPYADFNYFFIFLNNCMRRKTVC